MRPVPPLLDARHGTPRLTRRRRPIMPDTRAPPHEDDGAVDPPVAFTPRSSTLRAPRDRSIRSRTSERAVGGCPLRPRLPVQSVSSSAWSAAMRTRPARVRRRVVGATTSRTFESSHRFYLRHRTDNSRTARPSSQIRSRACEKRGSGIVRAHQDAREADTPRLTSTNRTTPRGRRQRDDPRPQRAHRLQSR